MNTSDKKNKVKKSCEKHGAYMARQREVMGVILETGCQECINEKEQEKDDQRKKLIQAEKTRWISDCGTPERYKNVTLDSINPHQDQLEALEKVRGFSQLKGDKNLIICGLYGTGKTMIACGLIHTLGTGKYVRAADMARHIRDGFKTQEPEASIIKSYTSPKVLVIDELGLQADTDHEFRILSEIIDRRYGDMKPTVLISNLTPDKIANQLGTGAWDRISSNVEIITLVTKSKRGK